MIIQEFKGGRRFDTSVARDVSALVFEFRTCAAEALTGYKQQFEQQAEQGTNPNDKSLYDLIVERLRTLAAPSQRSLLKDMGVRSKPVESKHGWSSKSFPDRETKAKSDVLKYKYLVAPDKSGVAIPPDLDLSRVLIPKFRGIHYRTEETSRFSSDTEYQRHLTARQTKKPTYSPAVYKRGSSSLPGDPRPRLSRHNKESLDRIAKSSRLKTFAEKRGLKVEDLVLPPLAEDEVWRSVRRIRKMRYSPYKFAGKMKTAKNAKELEVQEQLYVNQYGKYEKNLASMQGDMEAIPQVSTSDSPYHAAMYALGAKFSTQAEMDAKALKSKKASNGAANGESMSGGRRTRGTVGKVYTYFFTLEELLALEPMIVPVLQAQERIHIKPLQTWEVETTFYGDIPGQFLVQEMNTDIPKKTEDAYQKISDTDAGHRERQKMSADLANRLWAEAERLAHQRGCVLMPHGALHQLLGKNLEPSVKELLKRQRDSEKQALEHLNLQRRLLQERLQATLSNLGLVSHPIPGDGNCLFRAVSRCVYGHENQQVRLRQEAAAHILHHLHIFHSVDAAHCETMRTEARGGWDSARWGGEPEIFALSRLLRRRIVVHSLRNPEGTTYEDLTNALYTPLPDRAPVHIYFKGGNHYEAWS